MSIPPHERENHAVLTVPVSRMCLIRKAGLRTGGPLIPNVYLHNALFCWVCVRRDNYDNLYGAMNLDNARHANKVLSEFKSAWLTF